MLGALEAEGSGYLLNRQICFGKQHFGYFVFFFVYIGMRRYTVGAFKCFDHKIL